MYVRTVKAQTKPGQVEELTRRWGEFFGARRQQGGPGPRTAFIAGDPATNTTLSVTVWDAKPDEALVAGVAEAFGELVRDLVAGPPTFEEYEVIVEV